jgi:hypothetical protein
MLSMPYKTEWSVLTTKVTKDTKIVLQEETEVTENGRPYSVASCSKLSHLLALFVLFVNFVVSSIAATNSLERIASLPYGTLRARL